MMISPKTYISDFMTADYHDLMKERDRLIRYIRKYEKSECAGDRSGEEWNVGPSPDVRYQLYLDYLTEMSILMRERYNTEYVWGDKKLSDPVQAVKMNDRQKKLLMMDGLDPDEIYDRAKESREQVRRSLKLFELTEEVQDKLISKGVKQNRPH